MCEFMKQWGQDIGSLAKIEKDVARLTGYKYLLAGELGTIKPGELKRMTTVINDLYGQYQSQKASLPPPETTRSGPAM